MQICAGNSLLCGRKGYSEFSTKDRSAKIENMETDKAEKILNNDPGTKSELA